MQGLDSVNKYHLLAACIMHIEGYFSTQSLAFRNKNPGNLRPVGKTTGFQTFDSAVDGYAALYADIYAHAGLITLSEFIARYAPPTENNSVLYLHLASELSGISPTEVL
jgi:hypothetical protein